MIMPLTEKGEKIMAAMTRPESEGGYGPEHGKEVFYASANAGTITGVHEDGGGKRKRRKKRLAKAGFRRVLYLFFKAEQGSLFTMPTGVKGYVTKRGKVVSAYTAKRKKAGDDQSGDLFGQAEKKTGGEEKPKPTAEIPPSKTATETVNAVPGGGRLIQRQKAALNAYQRAESEYKEYLQKVVRGDPWHREDDAEKREARSKELQKKYKEAYDTCVALGLNWRHGL